MSSHSPDPETPGTDHLASMLAAAAGGNLQSLLAARAGGDLPGDPAIAALLSAGEAGSAGSDPNLVQSLAMRWLEQRLAPPPDEDETGESEEDLELQRIEEIERRQRIDEKRQQMLELKQVLTSLYDEVETLRARNDALAAALGACYLCFGEDPACPECQGDGVPGAGPIDAAAFRQFVVPALRRVRAPRVYRRQDGATRKEGNGARDEQGHGHTDDDAP